MWDPLVLVADLQKGLRKEVSGVEEDISTSNSLKPENQNYSIIMDEYCNDRSNNNNNAFCQNGGFKQ